MTTYKEITIERLDETVVIIERINDDGSISYIPTDPANSDYQAYLNPVEQSKEITTPQGGNE